MISATNKLLMRLLHVNLYTWVLMYPLASAMCIVQGDCINDDPALQWLANELSENSAISCGGSALQLYNEGRYWGIQYGKNATISVFPYTKEDVSHAVIAAALTPLGRDLSFVSGGHGQTNASTTTGFMIDLSWMNTTHILHNVTLDDTYIRDAISYESGATWQRVYNVTNGSGYMLVGARDGTVGVGGFSTGGGIGFLAGAHGFAIDRLRAVEIVTMSGEIVLATKTNQYSDLFWALQGGNGQFGIATRFWQEAVPEPKQTDVGVWVVAEDSLEQAYVNIAKWFDYNEDPFSVVYYAVGYLPVEVTTGPLGVYTTIAGYRFSNPLDLNQKSFDETFKPVLHGLSLLYEQRLTVPIAKAPELLRPYFPYGFRRGFWGPQTTRVTAEYIKQMSHRFAIFVTDIVSRGESPYSSTWVLQYMSPGLNGHLPGSNEATAWPHAIAGHQTLFSPAWNFSRNDCVVDEANAALNNITYAHQAALDPPFLADYPNYMSPSASGHRIFGDNMRRLIAVKNKYDPWCRLHQGRVFATSACKIGGWANLFPADENWRNGTAADARP